MLLDVSALEPAQWLPLREELAKFYTEKKWRQPTEEEKTKNLTLAEVYAMGEEPDLGDIFATITV